MMKLPGMTRVWSRRCFLQNAALAGTVWSLARPAMPATAADTPAPTGRTPVIDITDLYHPAQDPGDNVDLIAAYGLPEVDLKAVIFDVTDRYRRPHINPDNHSFDDPTAARDPGFIPVQQLNYLFDRNVPCACVPFAPMFSPDDAMRQAPAFQQAGIDLMLQVLRDSPVPVEILSFGSARPVAVALNREPELMRRKVARVRLCAGAYPSGFLEWNVQLDVHAFVRVLRSDLPVDIYPCGTQKDAFDLGVHNTFWRLPEFSLIRRVRPALQRYLAYAMTQSKRVDFLRTLEDPVAAATIEEIAKRPHSVWETDVWMHAAGRRLVRRADGAHRIIPAADLKDTDTVITNELQPCKIAVRDDGQFDMTPTDAPTNFRIFHRPDPEAHQRALIEALPELYASFTTVQS